MSRISTTHCTFFAVLQIDEIVGTGTEAKLNGRVFMRPLLDSTIPLPLTSTEELTASFTWYKDSLETLIINHVVIATAELLIDETSINSEPQLHLKIDSLELFVLSPSSIDRLIL